MSMFCVMASTLSGTRKKESSCPTSVLGRSLCLRKSSRTLRLMRQCLPTLRQGSLPSLHHLQTVVSFTPISSATSVAPKSSFSRDVPLPFSMLSSFSLFAALVGAQCTGHVCPCLRLHANILLYLTLFYFTLSCRGKARLPSAARDVAEERGRMTTRATTDNSGAPQVHRAERQKSTESKSAYKTTEFVVYVLAVLGVLIASMIVDQSFGADPAWRYVTPTLRSAT